MLAQVRKLFKGSYMTKPSLPHPSRRKGSVGWAVYEGESSRTLESWFFGVFLRFIYLGERECARGRGRGGGRERILKQTPR